MKCAGLMSSWNLQLGKSEVQRRVVDLSFRPLPDNLRNVGWAALRVLSTLFLLMFKLSSHFSELTFFISVPVSFPPFSG